MRRRRLVSAHLSARDADLLEWVAELAGEGTLSEAVKAGLRIAHTLCRHPSGREYLRRGILVEAFLAGLLPGESGATAVQRPPEAPEPPAGPVNSDFRVDEGPEERLAESLDRALGGF